MRFQTIKYFKVDDLELDQENYRFSRADDQIACVKKIYSMNKDYFRGLLKSVAEDGLGEPLLVYQNGNKNIVADGNRRVSVLKVLHSDEFAPSTAIKDEAAKLRKLYKINFNKIQAQVSNDKALISKTVFERHSSGKNGTSRIPWTAYAASRFGFDEKIGDDREWYIMALLSRTEKDVPDLTAFLDSTSFSYEVYRRIVRAALSKQIISTLIFSERGEKIKSTARKDLITDAVNKSKSFLQEMKTKKITLSRKDGGYADKQTIDRFLSQYSVSPEITEINNTKQSTHEVKDQEKSSHTASEGHTLTSKSSSPTISPNKNHNSDTTANKSGGDQAKSTRDAAGIKKSTDIENALLLLGNTKLIGLYQSLCTVSLTQHPQLLYVGAWSFLESLAANIDGKANNDFSAHFSNHMSNSWNFSKQQKNDINTSLKDIAQKGNANKHSKNYASLNAQQLKNDFVVLEPLIIKAIEEIIKK